MSRLNIRWKLTLWYGGALALVLAAFSTGVYFAIRHQMLTRIDQGLHEELSDVLHEVRRAAKPDDLLVWLNRRFAQHKGFDFQITKPDGTRFFVNARLEEKWLPLPATADSLEEVFETVSLDAGYRIVNVRAGGPDGPLVVQVARSLEQHHQEMAELLLIFVTAGPLTLLIAVAGGYLLARRALSPVHEITQTARRLRANQLDQRIAVANAHDELGALATTLNEMLERLEHSFQEMQRFTADAAHELRTPLAVMRTEAEVALRAPRSAEEYRRVLENLLEEVNRLTAMAEKLLFLSRHDAGLHESSLRPLNGSELLQEVVGHMRFLAEEKQITLTVEGGSKAGILADERQLRHVLYNLLDNAIKYTPAGGAVDVRATTQDSTWRVSIRDTGIGISADHLPHIFDRFYRADAARTAGAGAGLGLAICRSLMDAMHGQIEVESEPGRGATFRVLLPCYDGRSKS
jgi:heavy metal sensor kinase